MIHPRVLLDIQLKAAPSSDGLDAELVSPAAQKAVLNSFGMRCNPEAQCWPTVALTAADTQLSERTVQGARHALAVAGHITITARPGRAAIVTVTALVDHENSYPQGVQSLHPQRRRQVSRGVQPLHPGVQVTTKRGAATAPRSKKKNYRKLRGRTRDRGAVENGHVNVPSAKRDDESWGEYRERGGR